jgi:diphthamide biosynthesis protein 2
MASAAFAMDDGSRTMKQQHTVAIHSRRDTTITHAEENAPLDLIAFYDISRTVDTILTQGYRVIALQFPDAMLCHAIDVQFLLREALALKDYSIERMFILGDTSYGSCCVDEVAAQHLNADCVVHYGHTCLSPTSKLPVIFVFGNASCDPEAAASGFATYVADSDNHAAIAQFVLLYEPCYMHQAASITHALERKWPDKRFICSSMHTMFVPGM